MIHELEEYCARFSMPESDLLRQLREDTYRTVAQPHMLSGPVQGALLKMLVAMSGARRIIEVGTFTGYATLWMAEGLPENGQIYTLEADAARAAFAQRYFDQSPLNYRIFPLLGRALEVLQSLAGPFDLAFIDADKGGYDAYYEALLPKLRMGGLIVADNVLFRGEVLQTTEQQGNTARYMAQFNHKIRTDWRVENVILPVRDGLNVIRKIADGSL
ncbi:MAG: O-methyltransferase [Sphingobacteriales bacterium]|nr:MAG: O-methyltransferase [Sphingobacteriales bacterium]